MKRLIAALIVMALTGCASFQPPDDWTTKDTSRQIAAAIALSLDAATTARIHEYPGLEEGAPITRQILGPQPDPTETYIAAALLGVAHYWIGRRMTPERRRIWQYFGITIHSAATRINCDNGLC